jgi:hypothetical protein
MPFRLTHTLFAASLALASLAVHAQSTRAGLWEMNSKMGGNPEMDAAMAQMQKQMAAMPPEQRKMMEEMMAKQGVSLSPAAGGGVAIKTCVTPEMAAKQELPTQTEGECTTTVTSRSASVMKMNFVCKNPPSSGEGTYTFSGDTAFTMKMLVKTTRNGKPETTTIDGGGKWLSADCGNIKPPALPAAK